MRRFLAGWLLVPLVFAACGEEQPLDVGSELLPPQALRSFEVVLEPGQFLQRDTSFALYGNVQDADFMLLARDFEGVLNSHEFLRFQLPVAIAVKDTLGVARTDSAFTILRGELVLLVDTTAENTDTGDYRVALHSFAESWAPDSFDWEFRSPGTRWTVPGGTTGALIDTALVSPDSIILQVDSATMRQWADTTNARRGALLSLLDGPARIRAATPQLRVYAKSRFKPDTTWMVVSQSPTGHFDYRPRLATTSSDIRISGLPSWRSLLEFRSDLRNLSIPCGTGCTVPLKSLSITRAELVLQPVRPPTGFTPELTLQPAAYQALTAPEFPLERTPVGEAIGTVEGGLAPSRFVTGGTPAYLVLTQFLQKVVSDTTSAGSSSNWLVILPIVSGSLGVGTFAPSPRLRLVLSTAREIQLP